MPVFVPGAMSIKPEGLSYRLCISMVKDPLKRYSLKSLTMPFLTGLFKIYRTTSSKVSSFLTIMIVKTYVSQIFVMALHKPETTFLFKVFYKMI